MILGNIASVGDLTAASERDLALIKSEEALRSFKFSWQEVGVDKPPQLLTQATFHANSQMTQS